MELAALGIKVEGVSGVEKAATALDDLAKSGTSATSAVKGLGAASSAAAGPIDQAAAAEKRLADAAAKAGMSAAQMNAALRGVPAQFTDIVAALQAGQNPLTVFLQQGGQLKDMFGGAGNAARALGGYITGLISPFTLAAAAVAALGVAYFQGSKEQDAFVLALAKTGNQSGVTTSALNAYA